MSYRVKIISTIFFIIVALCGYGSVCRADVIVRHAISAELRYDNNATVAANNETMNDDVIIFLSPQLQVLNERGKWTLDGFYRAMASFHYKNTDINSVNHYATLGLNALLTRKWSLEANEAISYERESLLESALTGIQRSNDGLWSNTTSLQVNHQITQRASWSLNLSDSMMQFENSISVDSRSDSAGISGNYRITDSTSLTSRYTYATHLFFTSDGTTQLENHFLLFGFSKDFSPFLNLDLSVGAVYAPSVNESYDWVANTELRKSFESSSVSAGYTRTTTHTMGLTNLLNLSETFSLAWNYSPTNSFNISVFGTYYQNNTKPIDVVDITSYRVGFSGGWRLSAGTTVNAGYSHFEQTAHRTLGTDLTRDNVFINVRVTPYERRF
ncbi:MAG: hypothetical protein IT393_06545 [Nitrospirae bacterium]|nr:hypothetical protein [Nitrospirota bacterium]